MPTHSRPTKHPKNIARVCVEDSRMDPDNKDDRWVCASIKIGTEDIFWFQRDLTPTGTFEGATIEAYEEAATRLEDLTQNLRTYLAALRAIKTAKK